MTDTPENTDSPAPLTALRCMRIYVNSAGEFLENAISDARTLPHDQSCAPGKLVPLVEELRDTANAVASLLGDIDYAIELAEKAGG